MNRLFSYRDLQRWPHLRDDVLIWLSDEDTSSLRANFAKRHLANCRVCQEKQVQIERRVGNVMARLEGLLEQSQDVQFESHAEFVRRLDLVVQSIPSTPWWKRPFANFVPSFASAAFFAGAVLILFLFAHWKFPTVSANEFLVRAVASEKQSRKVPDGKVVRQRVRIETARKIFDRTIYRADSGLLRAKIVKIAPDEEDIAAHLASAGVNWEDPLSAASFKNWHDQQPDSRDKIYSTEEGFLTISTRLSNTNVVGESLTVAEDNFRSVEKTIEYKDIGEVSIKDAGSESVGSEVADQLFSGLHTEPSGSALAHPSGPILPSPNQIDETELQARLVLSQQNADTGEQIEIARNRKGVQVKGLVDTQDREGKLQESLSGIPYLTVTIKNLDELKSTSDSSAPPATTEESAVAQTSPLEQYFTDQGRSRDDLSRISSGLFNSSLEISRASRAIADIYLRFCSNAELSTMAVRSRTELLDRNTVRLLSALNELERFQKEAGIAFDVNSNISSPTGTMTFRLTDLADRNRTAAKKLISGENESPSPSIQSIAAELAGTAALLRAAALELRPGCGVPDQTGKPWE
jgi:hypothetical protein